MKKPLADDIEIVIAQETTRLRLPPTGGKEEEKPSAQTVFDLCIESMGVTSPLPVMRRSSGKCARRMQGNICDMP